MQVAELAKLLPTPGRRARSGCCPVMDAPLPLDAPLPCPSTSQLGTWHPGTLVQFAREKQMAGIISAEK